MQQGSNASAVAARTAGMTDEQILDLDLDALQTTSGSVAPDVGAPLATMPAAEAERPSNSSALQQDSRDDMALLNEAEVTSANAQGEREPLASAAQGEPAWLKQLEAQPAAAAEARQRRAAGWLRGFTRTIPRHFAKCWRKARACWRRAIRRRSRNSRGN
jgi:hypothetical protein